MTRDIRVVGGRIEFDTIGETMVVEFDSSGCGREKPAMGYRVVGKYL